MALDRPWPQFHVVRLGARVVHHRPVGDGQSGPVAVRVFAVVESRQFARRRNAFLAMDGLRELAVPAVVHFRALDDVSGGAGEDGRFIVRNLGSGRNHFVHVAEGGVLNVRNFAGNCKEMIILWHPSPFYVNFLPNLLRRQAGLSGFHTPLLLHLTVRLPTLSRCPSPQVMLSTTPVLNGSLAFLPGDTTWMTVMGSSMIRDGQVSLVPSANKTTKESYVPHLSLTGPYGAGIYLFRSICLLALANKRHHDTLARLLAPSSSGSMAGLLTVILVFDVAEAALLLPPRPFAARLLRPLADGSADGRPSGLDGAGPAASRVLLGHAAGKLLRTPPARHARGSRRSVVVQLVAAVAFVHDLTVVGHLLDVRPVVVVALRTRNRALIVKLCALRQVT